MITKHEYGHLSEIINKYKIFCVPYYQRNYVWAKVSNGRNLYKFVDDIFNQFNDDPNSDYFVGTLAFCSETKRQRCDIIDGQQRITSLVLILSELAHLGCSDEIHKQHESLLFPLKKNSTCFVIQESQSLTEELKYWLKYDSNFKAQDSTADISKAIDIIDSLIQLQGHMGDVSWFDSLYKYILEKISFIWVEYSTINESLKYFLNINSLSVPLKQSDIFFSILSEAIRISDCTAKTIYEFKNEISKIGKRYSRGLNVPIEHYDAYDKDGDRSVDNIIYVFLNSYYEGDSNIGQLNDAGVGKWLSVYKNEVFKSEDNAKDFVSKFESFIKDFSEICSLFGENNRVYDNYNKSSLCTSTIFFRSTNYSFFLKFLILLFKDFHNYRDNQYNLYKTNDNQVIDMRKLNEIAKRLNLTILSNCVTNKSKFLDGFEDNAEHDNDGNYKISADDILGNINYHSIFTLEYNDGGPDGSKAQGNDDSKKILLIFACQEAYLNSEASKIDVYKDINDYLLDLLTGNYSIEHIYSKKEYDDDRRALWNRLHDNMFEKQDMFNAIRFNFENLSLLDSSSNSSANKKTIDEKLNIYRNARSILGGENEYLIQSLVCDSDFYTNPYIQDLHLPDRHITIDQTTWTHSENNRTFNLELTKQAFQCIADK